MTLKANLKKWTRCIISMPSIVFIALIFLTSCEDEGPVVTFSAPDDDEVILKGTSVTISVTAVDNDGKLFTKAGIEKVQFLIDDVVVSTDETSPYSYTWTTSSVSLGNHTITVIAFDTGDNQQEEEIQVIINDAPTCTITNPGSIAYVQTTVEFEVTATDQMGGIKSVEFYLDNSLLSTDNTSPYAYSWNIGNTSLGSHTLKATAIDIYDEKTSDESTIEIKQQYIVGTWEGEYSGYDDNLNKNVTFRRQLEVKNDKTYSNALYGRPSNYSSDIVFEQESGTWEVNDAGTQVAWTPTTCQRINISNPGTLVNWSRGVHYEVIELNSAHDEWAVKDENVSVDYYIKKQ